MSRRAHIETLIEQNRREFGEKVAASFPPLTTGPEAPDAPEPIVGLERVLARARRVMVDRLERAKACHSTATCETERLYYSGRVDEGEAMLRIFDTQTRAG